jgi:hypothetical protein
MAGEEPNWHRFEILLINKSDVTLQYPPLRDAWLCGDLEINLMWDMDKSQSVQNHFHPLPWGRINLHAYLRPGEHESAEFSLRNFGYRGFPGTGEYEVRVVFRTPQGRIYSPAWKLKVVDVPNKDVLASFDIPLSGFRANQSPELQERVAVQQLRLGKGSYLVYRRFHSRKNGGGVETAIRLREIPGKVKMSVDGEYGDRPTPITIKFDDPAAPTGSSTLVIQSYGGMWDDGLSRIAPAPRQLKR